MWCDTILEEIHKLEEMHEFTVVPVLDLEEGDFVTGLRGEVLDTWGFGFACSLKKREIYIPESVVYDEEFEDDAVSLAAFCHEVGHIINHADKKGGINIRKILTIEAEAWLDGIHILASSFPYAYQNCWQEIREFICKAVNTYWNRKELNRYETPDVEDPWYRLIILVGLEFSSARNLYVIAEAEDE